MPIVKTVSCALDCPDACRFQAVVRNGRIQKLVPDRQHPVTRGFSCKKGRRQVERMQHPDRIQTPLIRTAKGFEPISTDQAIEIIAEKLSAIREQSTPEAVLNYTGDGYGGLKSRIQKIFFNCFGGSSVPEGSLCWGAGLAAQKYDFGAPRGHDPGDLLNARTILVWGRNPRYTSLHLHALLRKARQNGSRIFVIDPLKTATAEDFEDYIRIRPSTDGALALGMANEIIRNGWVDDGFVRDHVKGFKRFQSHVQPFDPETVEEITGVPAHVLSDLTRAYALAETACIYAGFGLQRYHNGGNTIRCIDALGAITGKIGKKGCGVNYAAKSFGPYLSLPEDRSKKYVQQERKFPVAQLGRFLKTADNPKIKAAFILCGNPLTQSPDLHNVIRGFEKIDFKVVFDMFMTDTARHADIILPAAFSFEQEDIVVSGMYSPVLNYSEEAVSPPDGVMPEFEFYVRLADRLGISLGFADTSDFLSQCAAGILEKENLGFQDLKTGYVKVSGETIPWESRQFQTPSGKIEIYSESARADGLSPLPEFRAPYCAPEEFPVRLLTTHAGHSMHSQGFAFYEGLPKVYLHPRTAALYGLEHQEAGSVLVTGEHASITAQLVIDHSIYENTALIYQGYWHQSGAVNFLTSDGFSDMGGQAGFYDSFCRITPASV